MAHCKVCNKDIDISTMGKTALVSHSKGIKHKTKMAHKAELAATCGRISNYMGSSAAVASTSGVTVNKLSSAPGRDTQTVCYNMNEQLKAETIWSLKMATSNYSFSSCSDLSSTFSAMFPDSAIAQGFSMSETKSMYIMSHGIAPYIESLVHNHVKESKEYVLLFDETLNKNLQKKQMDMLVRFWDADKVVSRYFNSVFFGHGTAIDINQIMETHVQATLGYSDLVQLSMDGPNVNWALYHKVEESLADKYDRKISEHWFMWTAYRT